MICTAISYPMDAGDYVDELVRKKKARPYKSAKSAIPSHDTEKMFLPEFDIAEPEISFMDEPSRPNSLPSLDLNDDDLLKLLE